MMHKMLRILLLAGCLVSSLAGCDLFASAESRIAKADQLIAANDRRGAMIQIKNVLQDDPAHTGARVRLAELELYFGDAVSAEKDVRRAIADGAAPATTGELAAQVSLALGQAGDLLSRIDSGELVLAGSTRAYYRAQAMAALQQYDNARAEFESIGTDDARWIAARVGMAQTLAQEGKGDAAVEVLDPLLAAHPDAFDGWVTRGAIRAARGEFTAAETDLKQARSLAGAALPVMTRVKLLASLAEVQLARSDVDGATATQADIEKLAPDTIVSSVIAARIAMAKFDYAGAVGRLQHVVASAPNLVPPRFLLGAALLAQGNLGQAEQHLSQVVRSAPGNLEARKLLAQAQLRLGRAEAAQQVLADADRPDDPQLEMLLGLARIQQGEATEGIAHLERAVAARPADVDARLDLATVYLKTGRPGDAVALLDNIPAATAPLRRSRLLVAALLANEDVRRARQEVERLLAAEPRNTEALELAAAFHVQQREFAQARGLAERISGLAPASVDAAYLRARIEIEAGDAAAAQKWLEKVLTLDAAHAPAHLALAELALRRGDQAAAKRTLEDLRKRDADSVEARLRLAGIHLRAGDSAAAAPVIAELSALGKNRPEVLNALGNLYFDIRRYDAALDSFRAAASLDEAQPLYWFNTARAQVALGAIAPAREALGKALAAQPGWLPAVGLLTMLDVREGNGAAALARVSALETQRPRDAGVLALKGDVQLELRDYASAAKAYDAAAALRLTRTLAVKAYRARQLGSLPAPLRTLETWVASHPEDLQMRLALGDACQRAGDRKCAVQQYETIVRAGKASPLMLNNLAWLYYELKDPRAGDVARRAYEGAPEIAAVGDTYGWILAETGQASQAVPLLKRASETSEDPHIAYHYGIALLRSGSAREGREVLGALLQRAPDFELAGEARKILASAPSS